MLGWQGIVPCKRFNMAERMVDVTINGLLKIPEVFARLSPKELSRLLLPMVSPAVLFGCVPSPILSFFLKKTSTSIINNAEKIVDVKSLVCTCTTKIHHNIYYE